MINTITSKPLRYFAKNFGQSKHPYPLEGILRPSLEYGSAIVSGSFSIAFLAVPQVFLMSTMYGSLTAAVFAGFSLRRAAQALLVTQYKILINRMPKFEIELQELHRKLSKQNKLYLGMGFQWDNVHTQRYYDLEVITDFRKYIKPAKDNPLGGKPHLHGVGADLESHQWLDINDRIGHMLVYGQARSGKSRALELLLEQDIHSGECVFLIDPKGDKDLFKRMLSAARAAGRMNDVEILHLGFPQQSVRYNPIGNFQSISEVPGRISSKLPQSGDSHVFASFAWRFIFIVAKALHVLGHHITIREIKKHVSDLDCLLLDYSCYLLGLSKTEFLTQIKAIKVDEKNTPRHLMGKSATTVRVLKFFDNYENKDDVLSSIISAYNYEKTYYDKITASLLPFLEKLNSLGETISPEGNSQLPELNLEESITKKKIVYFGLDGLSDSEVSHALGAMFFADAVSVSGKFYKYKETFNPVFIHADEFNDVIGDDFIPLLNKAGGAGVIVTAYTQTDQDIELGFNNNQVKALVAKGNFRTVGCMRVATEETAKYFTQRLPDVMVKYSVSETSVSESVTKNKDRRGINSSATDSVRTEKIKLISPQDLMALPVGQMFLSKNGSQIFKLRFPLIHDDLNRSVGSIEKRGLGNMIFDVNLKTFKFNDGMNSHKEQVSNNARWGL